MIKGGEGKNELHLQDGDPINAVGGWFSPSETKDSCRTVFESLRGEYTFPTLSHSPRRSARDCIGLIAPIAVVMRLTR